MVRNNLTLAALGVLLSTMTPVLAQQTPPLRAEGQGQESANFGVTPFSAVPQITLTEAAMAQLRALEDKQLLARRALEDRFAAEMRALLAAQAEERATLIATIAAGQ